MSVIGEAVEVISVTWTVWSWCKEGNGRIHDAYRVVSKTKARLEALKPLVEQLLDRKKQPEIYEFLKETLESLKEDVSALAKLIEKYKNGLLGDKLWFLGKYLSKVDELVKRLEEYLKDIIDIAGDVARLHQNDDSRSKAEKKAKTDREISKARQKQNRAEMDLKEKEQTLIWRLMQSKGQRTIDNAARSNDTKEWEAVELALMTMDENISRVDARRILGPLRQAIRDMPRVESGATTNIAVVGESYASAKETNDNLKPPKGNTNRGRSSLPSQGVGNPSSWQNKTPTPKHAPSSSPSLSPSPPSSQRGHSPAGTESSATLKMKHVSSIACVDFENSARSVMAQLYFEHRRIWTANTSGHWLFDSVESAGVGIKTDFAAAAVAAAKTNITLGTPASKPVVMERTLNCFYASFNNQISRDTKPVYERIKAAKRQGIKLRMFRDFDHIICFGAFTRGVLADMEKYAQTLVPLGGRPLKAQISVLEVERQLGNPSDEVMQQMLAQVREKVDSFLVTTLNWKMPEVILWNGMYRTRQFLLVDSKKDLVRAKTVEIKKEGKCKLVKDYSVPGGRLVTLVAPKSFADLEKLEQEVIAACS